MCKAVNIVTTCGDSMQKSVHLAVIQALLTIATSEHFVPHGETLVQCLKVVFNLAIATDDELVTLTAQNALLQVCSSLLTPTYVHVYRECSVPQIYSNRMSRILLNRCSSPGLLYPCW